MFQRRAATSRLIDLAGVLIVGDSHHGLSGIDAVLDVLGCKQGGAGHGQGAQLHQAQHDHVPLGDPGQHDEDPVALLDAPFPKGIGVLVGKDLQVPECMMLDILPARIDRKQRQFRAVVGPFVHNVKPEIEILGHLKAFVGIGGFVVRHVGGYVFHQSFLGLPSWL